MKHLAKKYWKFICGNSRMLLVFCSTHVLLGLGNTWKLWMVKPNPFTSNFRICVRRLSKIACSDWGTNSKNLCEHLNSFGYQRAAKQAKHFLENSGALPHFRMQMAFPLELALDISFCFQKKRPKNNKQSNYEPLKVVSKSNKQANRCSKGPSLSWTETKLLLRLSSQRECGSRHWASRGLWKNPNSHGELQYKQTAPKTEPSIKGKSE